MCAALNVQAIELKNLLLDNDRTQFVVVTIPTALATLESERLIQELKEKGVGVRSMIINQVAKEHEAAGYADRVVKSQVLSRCVFRLLCIFVEVWSLCVLQDFFCCGLCTVGQISGSRLVVFPAYFVCLLKCGRCACLSRCGCCACLSRCAHFAVCSNVIILLRLFA